MKNIIKFFIRIPVRILIYIIERWEYRKYKPTIKDETFLSLDVSGLSVTVPSHNGRKNVTMIHQCAMDYMYTITLENGEKITAHGDHPLYTINRYHRSPHNAMQTTMKEAIDKHMLIRCRGNKDHGQYYFYYIKKWRKSWLPYAGYDITVDGDRIYDLENGIETHNCVTADSTITINDNNQQISLGELYHGSRSGFLSVMLHYLYWKRRKMVKK